MPKKCVVKSPEVTVRLAKAVPVPTLLLKVTSAMPAFTIKPKAPSMVDPKLMPTPAGVPPTLVLSTVVFPINVTPPVPKSRTCPGLRIKPPMLLGALFVKFMLPLNKNVSVPATSPIVTRPLLRKATFWANVLVAPVMVTV